MPYCPCCSDLLLRHTRSGEVYFYCPHCRQEMPTFLGNDQPRGIQPPEVFILRNYRLKTDTVNPRA